MTGARPFYRTVPLQTVCLPSRQEFSS